MKVIAEEEQRPVPALAPRIVLHLTETPVAGPERRAGEGTIDQVLGDLDQLRLLDADTVVLDPFDGDADEIRHPEIAWRALAAVVAGRPNATASNTGSEKS
jgi:hypothetical protein